jgi:hypothetical protein
VADCRQSATTSSLWGRCPWWPAVWLMRSQPRGCSGLDPNRGAHDDFTLQLVLWIGGPRGRAKPPSPRILRAATGCALTASTLGRWPQNGARYDDEVAPPPNPRLERNRLAMASQ